MQRSGSNEIENKDISEERKEHLSDDDYSSQSGEDFKEELEDVSQDIGFSLINQKEQGNPSQDARGSNDASPSQSNNHI